jgi:hypothetical protein
VGHMQLTAQRSEDKRDPGISIVDLEIEDQTYIAGKGNSCCRVINILNKRGSIWEISWQNYCLRGVTVCK